MMNKPGSVNISHVENYKFLIEFGGSILQADEPEPIGSGAGPSPEQMLVAGVTNCLCASLFFALKKHRLDGSGIRAEANFDVARNDRGRLRMRSIEVGITLGEVDGDSSGAQKALAEFEDFCTVTESVKRGIPVGLTVTDRHGKTLHSRLREEA